MLDVKVLENLSNNDGLTLKKFKAITYKTGWQVATEGIETKDAKTALEKIMEYNGNCGVWFSNGVYYIDKSKRISTKKEALKIGKECNQISILKWQTMELVYC